MTSSCQSSPTLGASGFTTFSGRMGVQETYGSGTFLVAVARDVQERVAQRLLCALYAGHVEQAHAVASERVEQVPTVCRASALHHVREHLDYADLGDVAFHGEPLSHLAAHRPAAYHGDAARLAEKLRLTEQARGGHGQAGIDELGETGDGRRGLVGASRADDRVIARGCECIFCGGMAQLECEIALIGLLTNLSLEVDADSSRRRT